MFCSVNTTISHLHLYLIMWQINVSQNNYALESLNMNESNLFTTRQSWFPSQIFKVSYTVHYSIDIVTNGLKRKRGLLWFSDPRCYMFQSQVCESHGYVMEEVSQELVSNSRHINIKVQHIEVRLSGKIPLAVNTGFTLRWCSDCTGLRDKTRNPRLHP